MFSVSYMASNDALGSKPENRTYDTLEQFNARFINCKKGIKNGPCFIRGCLTDDERCDENLPTASLLIIDGDSGKNGNPTPDPQDCYEALIRLGYSFIIYTTFSHTEEKPKYRVIVELSEEIRRHELAANLNRLLDELAAEGINFQRVKEMYSFSQVWYLPRRADPLDGLYRHMANFEGTTFTTIHVTEAEAQAEKAERQEAPDKEVEAQSVMQLYENIVRGVEIHPSIVTLTYQLAKDGVSRALIIAQVRSALIASSIAGTETQRWLDRMNEIEGIVDGGIRLAEEEANDDEALDADEIHFDDGEIRTYSRPMPLPPARAGRLLNKLHNDMMRPSIEVAHISTFSLLAALCGAKFNAKTLKKDGLNMWFLLIAKTGEGKSQVKDFLTHVLVNNMNGNIINYEHPLGSFMMTSAVTTPKIIFNHLAQGRSFVHVMPEAGLNGLEKSGSPKSVLAAQLELFTSSGIDKLANNKHMSDEKDNLKPIKNPAYSMFMESSPDAFSKAAKEDDLFNIGFLPRCTTFMLLAPPKINRVKNEGDEFDFVSNDLDITQQIGKIAKSAAAVQAADIHTVNLVTFKSVYAEYLDLCDMHNELYNGQQYLHEISTRVVVNMVKLASLVTIFNSWDGEESIEVDIDAWEYAKDFYQWYMENILLALGFMSIKNEFNEAESIIKKAIVQTYNRSKVEMQSGKQIRVNDLLNVLKKNGNSSMLSKIATLTKYMRKPTMEVVFSILEGMQKTNQIKIVTGTSEKKRGVKYIQVLSGFNS